VKFQSKTMKEGNNQG